MWVYSREKKNWNFINSDLYSQEAVVDTTSIDQQSTKWHILSASPQFN